MPTASQIHEQKRRNPQGPRWIWWTDCKNVRNEACRCQAGTIWRKSKLDPCSLSGQTRNSFDAHTQKLVALCELYTCIRRYLSGCPRSTDANLRWRRTKIVLRARAHSPTNNVGFGCSFACQRVNQKTRGKREKKTNKTITYLSRLTVDNEFQLYYLNQVDPRYRRRNVFSEVVIPAFVNIFAELSEQINIFTLQTALPMAFPTALRRPTTPSPPPPLSYHPHKHIRV